jgi:hypothetical protein
MMTNSMCVSVCTKSGGLLLTNFIQCFTDIVVLPTDDIKKQDQLIAFNVFTRHFALIDKLLCKTPLTHLRMHQEERDALTLLSNKACPLNQKSLTVLFARSLIKRGANVNSRNTNGTTPVQHWCRYIDLVYTGGIMMLLAAGADLDMSHPTGKTVLANLISNKRVGVLRELSDASWLVSASLDVLGPRGNTPMQQLQRMAHKAPTDTDIVEMREILSAQKHHWIHDVRPAVMAELGVHEQLVPELAELIASYVI